jgi:hypothetical protein
MAYLLWRWAWTFPGSENYYFAPYMKPAREILWASRRIQTFGPDSWIDSVNDTEMRIRKKNGSFIKLEGADNDQALRGIKPRGLVITTSTGISAPTFTTHSTQTAQPMTPPYLSLEPRPRPTIILRPCNRAFSQTPVRKFFRFPTSSNPHIKAEWLERKRQNSTTAGTEISGNASIWPGTCAGANAIFPMLDKRRHVVSTQCPCVTACTRPAQTAMVCLRRPRSGFRVLRFFRQP